MYSVSYKKVKIPKIITIKNSKKEFVLLSSNCIKKISKNVDPFRKFKC